MSNLERHPAEVLLEEPPSTRSVELLQPREVPLGGPRAMTVRRTLPQRSRSLIGAWCFVDHYGPDDVAERAGMVVPPHPHTGLQTVSWLFAGEIEHRDSVGTHAMIRPGELNLMTAGRGIQHSELSTPDTTTLHGVQLWVALPEAVRSMDPRFDHYRPEPFTVGDSTISVFLGSLAGASSPVRTFSPLVGAQLDIPGGARLELDLDAGFEHGILLDDGVLMIDSEPVPTDTLAYLSTGRTRVTLDAEKTVRAVLVGGAPLGESIIMWWNFVGRTHDEIVEYRARWQEHVDGDVVDGRFGRIRDDAAPLPAPILPSVRLRERR